MSRLPTRFELLAVEIAKRTAPLLAPLVAEIVADRFGEVPPLLDTAGAARYLAAHPKTVRRWAEEGAIPVIRIGNGARAQLRFDREALRLLLSAADEEQEGTP